MVLGKSMKLTRDGRMVVLAPPDHLHLLWALIPRPPLPRLLSPTLLSPPGRKQWPIARPLFLAPCLCHRLPPLPFATALHSLPRLGAEFDAGVHMEPTKPGNEALLLGAAGVYGAIPAMGLDGLQSGATRDSAKG